MLGKTKGPFRNGQFRETVNDGHKTQKPEQKKPLNTEN